MRPTHCIELLFFLGFLYSTTVLLPSPLDVLDLWEKLDCLLCSMNLVVCVLVVVFNLSLNSLAFSLEFLLDFVSFFRQEYFLGGALLCPVALQHEAHSDGLSFS